MARESRANRTAARDIEATRVRASSGGPTKWRVDQVGGEHEPRLKEWLLGSSKTGDLLRVWSMERSVTRARATI